MANVSNGCRFAGPVVMTLALALGVAAPVARGEEPAPEPRSERAWLGVWLSDAVDGGVQILAVVAGGPAAEAGLRPGDLLLEAAGRPVADEAELGRVLRGLSPGQPMPVRVLRRGERVEAAVVLGRRQEAPTVWSVLPDVPEAPEAVESPPLPLLREYGGPLGLGRAGLQVTEITPALRAHYGAPEDLGVLVTRVEPDTPAARAGIEVGDVVVRVAERPVRNETELRGNLLRWSEADSIDVRVIRAGKPVALTFPVAASGAAVRSARMADRAARQEAVEHRLQEEIERLERRLVELKRELERLQESDD